MSGPKSHRVGEIVTEVAKAIPNWSTAPIVVAAQVYPAPAWVHMTGGDLAFQAQTQLFQEQITPCWEQTQQSGD